MKKISMKIKLVFGVLVVTLAALSCFSQPAAADGQSQSMSIQWASSADAAQKEAQQSGKLVMIDFYTSWCGWCKLLDQKTYTDSRVTALATGFVPLKLDAEQQGAALAKQFGVSGYPTIVFVDAQGKVVQKAVGYRDGDGFAKVLAQLLDYTSGDQLKQAGDAAPKDGSLQARLAILYATLGKIDLAKECLHNAEIADPKTPSDMLAGAYQAMAGYYFTKSQFSDAIDPLKRQISLTKNVYEIIGAKLKLAGCYINTKQGSEAIPLLNDVQNAPQATKEEKESAQNLLAQME